MRACKIFVALLLMAVWLLGAGAAWAASEVEGSGDDPTLPQRPPQSYYVPDQDELQPLPAQPPANSFWGRLRQALTGSGQLDPGRDDPQHDPNLDQGP